MGKMKAFRYCQHSASNGVAEWLLQPAATKLPCISAIKKTVPALEEIVSTEPSQLRGKSEFVHGSAFI